MLIFKSTTMKKISLYTILFTTIFFGACEGSLDEVVYSDLLEDSYVYSDDEVYNVIGPAYSQMRSLYGGTVCWWMVQECSADLNVRPANSTGWDNAGLWRRFMEHSWTSNEWQLDETWYALYRGALHASRIIDQLESDAIPIPAGESKEALIAEMKVARAFYNWLILDNFGDAPLVRDASTDIPEKTSRSEIYAFVVDEIENALTFLSEEKNTETYGRFNKWAAKTLLANVYLNAEVYTGQAEWAACMSECDDIIASGQYSLEPDFRTSFITNNEISDEIIFAIPYDEIYAGYNSIHNFSLHAASQATFELESSPWGAGGFCANPLFIDTFDPDDNRLGKTYLMGPQYASDGVTPIYCLYEKSGDPLVYTKELPDGVYVGENEGYRINKFEYRLGAKGILSNDFPFFRYAQVLMMKAECLLRTGQGGQAAQIVTEVRERAFVDDPGKAPVSSAQLEENTSYQYGYVEDYVMVDPGNTDPVQYGRFLDELAWEFAVEGTRRRDLIRFGVFTTKSWLSHTPNGDHRVVFPIIQGAIDANPNLIQNPNY
jgi:hypothetical protein